MIFICCFIKKKKMLYTHIWLLWKYSIFTFSYFFFFAFKSIKLFAFDILICRYTHICICTTQRVTRIYFICAQTHICGGLHARGTRNATNRAHAIWFVLILTYGFYGLKWLKNKNYTLMMWLKWRRRWVFFCFVVVMSTIHICM